MARSKRVGVQKRFLYFFLNGKIHKVLKSSRAKDELIAWCYPDKKRVLYSYNLVAKNMENDYTLVQAGKILNRHKVTLEEYILVGKVSTPQKVYPIGNPESTWSKYMLSESDIIQVHEFILEAGQTKDLPSKAELLALLKSNIILYTKTNEGKYVPVWKAEE
jgi:hypothetical protein